ERIARIQVLIDEVLEGSSVELIGAGLHGHIDDGAARLPEFGGVIARLERDLLNGVRVRLGHLRVNIIPRKTRGGVLAFDTHRLGKNKRPAQTVYNEWISGRVTGHAW